MEKMKNSGIEWIGEIPEDWSVIRLKHSAWLKGRIGWQGLRSDEFKEEGPYLITGTDFDNGIVNWNTCVHITESRFREAPEIHIHEDDLLITKDGTIGKTAIAKNCPEKVSLNSGVFIVRNTGKYKYVSKFLYYIIQSNEFTLWFDLGNVGNSTIKHLNQEMFYNFQFALPPLETQKRIADFLDEKCVKIDGLKNDIQKQIETLEQYKKSVITEAVTKGINPNAKMKDSGSKWMPLIPEHWNMDKLKYNLTVHEIKGYGDKEVLSLYRELGIVPKNSRDDNHNVTSEDTSKYKYVRKGDFVINKMKAWQGSVAVSDYEGIVSPAYYVYEFITENYDKRYFHHLMRNKILADEFRRISGGIREGQWDLDREQFENMYLPVPPKSEQIAIADFIDSKYGNIEKSVELKKQQLEKLEEYKKSLIFEYVTGKREVSGGFSSKTSEKKGV